MKEVVREVKKSNENEGGRMRGKVRESVLERHNEGEGNKE